MRIVRSVLGLLVVLLWSTTVSVAQEETTTTTRTISLPILVIESDRLFADSEFGKRVVRDRIEAERALAEENGIVAAELEQEELTLTEQRKTMEPAEFRAAAELFDQKVQDSRDRQIGKQLAIAQSAEAEQRRFAEALNPVFSKVLNDFNALIIMERRSAFAVREILDVTDLMIQEANRILGDGAAAE